MKTKNYYIAIIIILFSSCIKEDRFLIIKDTDYMEPAHRLDKVLNNDTLYSLHHRYFVFNYSSNMERFDSLSKKLLCDLLNDSLIISNCDFDFQDTGWQAKDNDHDALSAVFTKTLVTYSWDISRPDVITSNWGELSIQNRKIVEFNCSLNKKYKNLNMGE